MKTYVFEVELEKEEDGRWSAAIPLLPGCATWGYTREEALESLREAAKAYLEVLFEEGRSLPKEVTEKITIIPSDAIAVSL
jgi:predicted RNase H-like HicB family nuclease